MVVHLQWFRLLSTYILIQCGNLGSLLVIVELLYRIVLVVLNMAFIFNILWYLPVVGK